MVSVTVSLAAACGGAKKAASADNLVQHWQYTSVSPIQDVARRHSRSDKFHNLVENSVSTCMASHGWHYIPRLVNIEPYYGAGDGPTGPEALVAYATSTAMGT